MFADSAHLPSEIIWRKRRHLAWRLASLTKVVSKGKGGERTSARGGGLSVRLLVATLNIIKCGARLATHENRARQSERAKVGKTNTNLCQLSHPTCLRECG